MRNGKSVRNKVEDTAEEKTHDTRYDLAVNPDAMRPLVPLYSRASIAMDAL
ncbi:MAG: hypothetical protein ACYC9L_17050 [Sulfuricaulis sp.]